MTKASEILASLVISSIDDEYMMSRLCLSVRFEIQSAQYTIQQHVYISAIAQHTRNEDPDVLAKGPSGRLGGW